MPGPGFPIRLRSSAGVILKNQASVVGCRLVGHNVVCTNQETVQSGTTRQRIVFDQPAEQVIVAIAAVQQVDSIVSTQYIGVRVSSQIIVAVTAMQFVVSCTAKRRSAPAPPKKVSLPLSSRE